MSFFENEDSALGTAMLNPTEPSKLGSVQQRIAKPHCITMYCVIVLAFLAGLYSIQALPSARQCTLKSNDPNIALKCKDNENHLRYDMPSDHAIYYTSNSTLQPPTKDIPLAYFPNGKIDIHRDRRFSKDLVLPDRNRRLMIGRLLEEFIAFTKTFDLRWWMVHGGLTGWYFNEDLMPWDTDVDVMVLYHDLITDYSKFHEFTCKNRYLFEINPNSYYRHFQLDDFIDARFIDKTNGLYMDITAVVYDPDRKMVHCKSPHYYDPKDVFPLKNGTFMGYNVWLPNRPDNVLAQEYGRAVLTDTTVVKPRKIYDITYDVEYYKFNEELQLWRFGARTESRMFH